ncbi:MAG: EFR1 family ferrodoxin [Alloprevotella sp.]
MIFFYSGNGNSEAVARRLGTLQQEHVCRLSDALSAQWTEERATFVFPVYAWGIPHAVEKLLQSAARLMERLQGKHITLVLTCGDDIGMADRLYRKLFHRFGLTIHAVCSVQMPNTYVGLPGFDTDSPALTKAKLRNAARQCRTIALQARQSVDGQTQVVRGALPRTKTYVLRPLFRLLLMGRRLFRTTDSCTRCAKCAAQCPERNIRLSTDHEKPQWQGVCSTCLRCYHHCPTHSIRYGTGSDKNGQYRFADYADSFAED